MLLTLWWRWVWCREDDLMVIYGMLSKAVKCCTFPARSGLELRSRAVGERVQFRILEYSGPAWLADRPTFTQTKYGHNTNYTMVHKFNGRFSIPLANQMTLLLIWNVKINVSSISLNLRWMTLNYKKKKRNKMLCEVNNGQKNKLSTLLCSLNVWCTIMCFFLLPL